MIASYLGNIVGALFVGLPALYCYLQDYDFTDTRLGQLENGEAPMSDARRNESRAGTVQEIDGSATGKEIYRVESKRS